MWERGEQQPHTTSPHLISHQLTLSPSLPVSLSLSLSPLLSSQLTPFPLSIPFSILPVSPRAA